jgi:acyl-CoA synthetase (AMP-forming)/AMP-acid ligase II
LESKKVLNQINEENVDRLTGNVFYFKKLLGHLQHSGNILPGVKEIGIGGSPVPEYLPQLLKNYFVNATIHIIYGSTQAEPIAVRTVRELKDPTFGYFVGVIHPDIEIRIDSSQKVNAGKYKYPAGLIYVKGAHVVLEKDQEWLNTGDYGYLDGNNELYLTGRQGNETLVEGYGHYQIENILNNIPQINQVAAIANKATFDIFYEGKVEPKVIRENLKMFPGSIINLIKPIKEMPLDNRHHSKILYQNLCTPNLKM